VSTLLRTVEITNVPKITNIIYMPDDILRFRTLNRLITNPCTKNTSYDILPKYLVKIFPILKCIVTANNNVTNEMPRIILKI
jgi:hypothetical protein